MNKQNLLSQLEPSIIWGYFEELCKIPHASGKEQKISQFIKEFGEKLKLETIVDKLGNVLIRKPATKGMEKRKGVTLQGHLDMVAEKDGNVKHDFDLDPIRPYIDGDWVKAQGTTLGSDNGIGLAMAMTILASKDIVHGPIQALFTTEEEITLRGAEAVTPKMLQGGEILINLDTELDTELYIGAAGGINTIGELMYQNEDAPSDQVVLKIEMKGLMGGHSGADIHCGRGNAIKLLTRLLHKTLYKYDIRLVEFHGGMCANAIPREAFAVILVDRTKAKEVTDKIERIAKELKEQYKISDPDFSVIITPLQDKPSHCVDRRTTEILFNLLWSCPNGVIRMHDTLPGLTETSTNLGRIRTEKGKFVITTMQRSSVDSALYEVSDMIEGLFRLAGAQFEKPVYYPGWMPNVNSEILAITQQSYQRTLGNDPKVVAIHAGLECGFFIKTCPNLDCISFGPTILNAHSPAEKVSISSVQKIWMLLLEVLKNIPEKNKT